MAYKSKIEWTEATWNPVVGCTKCSPGCLNCYAEKMARRLRNIGIYPYHQHPDLEPATKLGWTGIITCNDKALDIPLHWRKPRRIFVCSMSDLFHEKVPFEFIAKVWDIMFECHQHVYLILTKRIKRVAEFCKWMKQEKYRVVSHFNIHFGVSISTPDEMWKAEVLSRIPAAVRWISFEPLLADVGEIPLENIHGIVVGGESGPGARPMHTDWPRNIRDQCVVANVPFYFKQWGEWLSGADKYALKIKTYQNYYPKRVTRIENITFFRVGKKKAGCLLDGKEWKQLPERK